MFDDELGDEPDRPDPATAAPDPGTAAPDEAAALAAELAQLLQDASRLVGLPLAAALDTVCPDGQDPADLVELAAQWSRVISWAHARRAEAISALVVQTHDHDGPSNAVLAVTTEVAMRQGITRQAASRMVRTSMQVTGPLMATGEALRRGAIDPRKAEIIASALEHMPYQVCADVEDIVLPGAPGRTPPQLAKDLQHVLVSVAHHEAELRHRSARWRRRVCHPRTLSDGMASIYAVLPAEDAIALDLALDGSARAAKAAGDPRTIDQLRADVLAAAGADALARGGFGVPPDLWAKLTAAMAAATPDTSTTPPAAASTPTAPNEALPEPAPPDPPPSSSGPPQPPPPWYPIGQVGGVPVRINVTVPLTTLLGGGEPGDLDGYGAIDAATARALALGGTWRRLVTDPLSGVTLDVGRTRYRPPPDLAELVRARDRTCFRPGCGARASGCQLDHTIPFGRGPDGGTTSYGNLGPGCETDHGLKTDGDFRVRQVSPGVFEWTSKRTGRTYRREADGSTTPLDPQTGEPIPVGPDEDPPPF